jgi:hypothetical protein
VNVGAPVGVGVGVAVGGPGVGVGVAVAGLIGPLPSFGSSGMKNLLGKLLLNITYIIIRILVKEFGSLIDE